MLMPNRLHRFCRENKNLQKIITFKVNYLSTQVCCVDVCLPLEKECMDFNYKPGKEIPQQKIDAMFYKLAEELARNDLFLLKENLSNIVYVLSGFSR